MQDVTKVICRERESVSARRDKSDMRAMESEQETEEDQFEIEQCWCGSDCCISATGPSREENKMRKKQKGHIEKDT